MIDWAAFASGIDWSSLGSGVLLLLTGILSALGLRRGLSRRDEPAVEIAGALVDNSAINRLASSLEAVTVESITHRERRKDDINNLSRQIEDLTREIEEMRRMLALKPNRR